MLRKLKIEFLILLLINSIFVLPAFALSPPYVRSVAITGDAERVMYIGETITLKAIAEPMGVDYAYMDWHVDDESIIDIQYDDEETAFSPPECTAGITALAEGTATVTVYANAFMPVDEYSDASATVTIVVKEPTVAPATVEITAATGKNNSDELYTFYYATTVTKGTADITSVEVDVTNGQRTKKAVLAPSLFSYLDGNFTFYVGNTSRRAGETYTATATVVADTTVTDMVDYTTVLAQENGSI